MLINHVVFVAAISLLNFSTAQEHRPCGFKIAPCPEDQYCKPNEPDCTDLNKCAGTCTFKNTYPDCGGFRPNPPECDCEATCKDDPRTPDDCGMACDKPGICVPNDIPTCGGFAGTECPKGLYCYDDPNDECDPDNGGADCGGICL